MKHLFHNELLNKYNLIGELLELSRKSDLIIEKSVASLSVNESFFEEAKSKICEILKSKSSKKKAVRGTERENGNFDLKWRKSLDPLLEYRSRVHDRNISEDLSIQNPSSSNAKLASKSCNFSSSLNFSSIELNDNQAKPVSFFYTNENHVTKMKVIEHDSGLSISPKQSNSIENEQSEVIPVNPHKYASSLRSSSTYCQVSSCIRETESLQLTPNSSPLNIMIGKTYVCKNKNNAHKLLFDKHLSIPEIPSVKDESSKSNAITMHGCPGVIINTSKQLSSRGSAGESDKNGEELLMKKINYDQKKKRLAIEKHKEISVGGNPFKSGKPMRQFRTKSAPLPQGKPDSQKLKANTQFLSNCNRESLKVKAEEKRKQREIRVQKTKERRERLEKEREERIRLSEQRLKQRFQQHEEILKQKTEKFKIKSQNRKQSKAKRNLLSTSSKDSKEDREKDNDDFCRNSEDSGQKLSKESNGYHDVSLKKADLTSLEGNAGTYPEISKKHKAILVGCEKTPVEFEISCNGSELKKSKHTSVAQDVRRLEELKVSSGKYPPQHDKLHSRVQSAKCWSNSAEEKENMLFNIKQNNFVKSHNKRIYPNLSGSTEINSKIPKLNKVGHIKKSSKHVFWMKGSEKKHSHYLRSMKQIHRSNDGKYCSPFSPLNAVVNDNLNENSNYEHSCEIMNSTLTENKKRKYANSCFKCLKKHKSENHAINCEKTPFAIKTCHNNSSSLQKRNVKRNVKDSATDARKENGSKNTPSKPQSYKIPDVDDHSFEENKMDQSKIPLWAKGVYLKQALLCQNYKPPNVEKIFGIIPTEPVDLVAIFGNDKPRYHQRTSSENWNKDIISI